jgi:Uma2 family endonuclease
MAVRPQSKLTYDDYVLFPNDGLKRELIDGEVYVSPAPNVRHQRIALAFVFAIQQFLKEQGGGELFIPPCDVILSDTEVVQPDVIFVSEAQAGIVTDANIKGSPALLIEIVSNPTLDRRVKRDLYGHHEVSEYWIVDPDADQVLVYRLTNQSYGQPEIFEPGDTLSPAALPALHLNLAELLRR